MTGFFSSASLVPMKKRKAPAVGRRRFLALLLLVFFLFPLHASGEGKVFFAGETDPFPADAELLTIRVAGLLGADCMLVTRGDHSMFVDLGTANCLDQVKEVISAAGIDRVDYFFNTHPHNDHVGGFMPLLESGFPVGSMITFFPHKYFGHCVQQYQALQAAEKHNVPVIDMKTEEVIPFGDADLTAYRVPDARITRTMGPNHLSAMLMVRYGDCSALLSGDVEDRAQQVLADEYGPLLKADILKYPHHGLSKADQAFLDAVSPEYTVITNYPQRLSKTLAFLKSNGITRMNFSCWGITTLQTDGTKWIVSQDPYPRRFPEIRIFLKNNPWLQVPVTLP